MGRFALAGVIVLALPVWGQPDPVDIVRRSVSRDQDTFARAKDYTYVERVQRRNLDSQGRAKSFESHTFDVTMIEGLPYRREIERDDKPLSPEESRKAQNKFDKELRDGQSLSAEQKARREAEAEKDRREGREFLKEVPEAFRFQLVGSDQVDGHDVWVILAEPRAGYKPRAKHAGVLKKLRGKLWIDQSSYDWVRAEVEAVDTLSFGLLLARVSKGTRIEFHQRRINDQVWLPEKIHIHLDARLALLKHLNQDVDVTFRDYRKFQTDSRFIPVDTGPQ